MARDDISTQHAEDRQQLGPPRKMGTRLIDCITYKNNGLGRAEKLDLLKAYSALLATSDPAAIDDFIAVIGEKLNGQVWDFRPTEIVPARNFHSRVMSIAPKRPDGTREPRREILLNTPEPGENETIKQCLRIEPKGKVLDQLTQALKSLSEDDAKALRGRANYAQRPLRPKRQHGPITATLIEERQEAPGPHEKITIHI